MSSNRSKSGKVKTTLPTAVSADRYNFLQLSEAEPNLGVPASAGYVLSSDTSGNRSWIQVAASGAITIVGDDSTGTSVDLGETFKFAGTGGITTSVSGDTLTIDGTNVLQNTKIISVSDDTSTVIDFNAGETINVRGVGGIVTTVSGDTLTITGPDLGSYLTNSTLTFVGDDSTGTTLNSGETLKITGNNNITVAVTEDLVTITGSKDIDVNSISSSDSTAIQINDGMNVSGTLTANTFVTNDISSSDSSAIQINDSVNVSGTLTVNSAVINRIVTNDSSDININGAPVNFAAGGEVLYKDVATLNNLSDVEIENAQTDQFLRYNGSVWTAGSGALVSAGPGVNYFLTDPVITASDSDNDNDIITMQTSPGSASEQTVSQAINNTTNIIAAFASTALNRTTFDGGNWAFLNHLSVDSSSGTTTIANYVYTVVPFVTGTVTITGSGTSRTATASAGNPFSTGAIVASATNTAASYLQTPNGLFQITARTSDTVVTITTPNTYTNETGVSGTVWKKWFGSTTSPVINNTSGAANYNTESTQSYLNVTAATALGMIVFGTTTASVTLTFYYDGTDNASSFATPFGSLHNSLGGLQGGTSNEFYHLTSSEYTGTGTGTFVRANSPSIASATLTGTTTANTLVTNEISSADSTAIQVNDAVNISGIVTAATSLVTPSLVTNAISSGDSSVVTVNDDLEVKSQLFVNTISSNDSTRVVIADGVRISGLSYPTADGTNGQVITTDGAGNLAFQDAGGAGSGAADTVTFTGFGSNNTAVTDENVFGYVALDQSFGTSPSALDSFDLTDYNGGFYYVLNYNNISGERSMGSASIVAGNTDSSVYDASTSGGGGVVDGTGQGLSYSASMSYPTATLFAAGDSSINTATFYRISLGTNLNTSTVGDTYKVVSGSIGTTLATADSWSYSTYRGAKYYITVVSTDTGEASNIECLVVHDGVSAYITYFNEVFTENNSLLSLSADTNSGNVRLRASCNGPCVLYMHRILLSDSEAADAPNAYEKTIGTVNVSGSTFTTLDSYDYQDYAYSGCFYLVTAWNATTSTASVSEVYLATNGSTTASNCSVFVSSKTSAQLEFSSSIDSDGVVSLMAAASDTSGTTVCSIYRVALTDPPEAAAFKTMDTFSKTLYRGSKYTVSVWSNVLNEGNQFDVSVIHNGTTAFVTQYGWITTGTTYPYPGFITVDADVSGQNVILKGVSTGEATLRITMARHRIPI